MRTTLVAAVVVVGLIGWQGAAADAQQAGQQAGRGRGAAAAQVPNAPADKTAFWSAEDIQARWRENESLKRANSRLYNGPTNISGNVRIVLPNDPPLTHEATADLRIVTSGRAVARTDGEVTGSGDNASIRNAVTRNVKAGDILYVPPGVPHHYTDIKGFTAYLIRFDTLGVVRSQAAAPATAAGR